MEALAPDLVDRQFAGGRAARLGLVVSRHFDDPIDGEAFDATAFLNTAAAAVIREARHGGLVYREDLPPAVGILFPSRPPYPDSGRYGGRFACVDGGR